MFLKQISYGPRQKEKVILNMMNLQQPSEEVADFSFEEDDFNFF